MAPLDSDRYLGNRETEDLFVMGKNADGSRAKIHPLDMEKALRKLRKLESWLQNERDRQSVPRYQMALDEDFYDGLQWDDADAQVLADRGQAAYVYNRIQPSVDWLTGTEKRTRVDYRIYPRSSEDRNEADNKTKLFKYVDDVNRSAYSRSRAFEDAVKVGVGWLEAGLRADPTAELVYDRYESWRNMLYDSLGFDRDGDDMRYQIRQKWLDEDVAILAFPDRAHIIRSQATSSDVAEAEDAEEWYLGQVLTERGAQMESLQRRTMIDSATALFNRRERVKVYEMWYRMPEKVQFLIGGRLNGLMYDPGDEVLNWWMQKDTACSLIERVSMRTYCALFVKGHFLQDVRSPYRHNKFPFTPIWGKRRGRDGTPYGMVRGMRDPQEDFNKRMSKAIYILSSRRIIMDAGAVEDVEELREEAARPDSIIVKTPGTELTLTTDTQIAEEHLKFAAMDAQQIEVGGGVTDELMGRKTNAVSGKAIEARQDQGTAVTTNYFDNYRAAFQVHGQKKLSLIEQYYTFEKSIRVLGERKGYDFIEINKQGQGDDGQPAILNDITRAQADFIVAAQDFRETIRLGMSEQLMELVGKLAAMDPMLAMKLLDDVLEFNDVPGVEGIIKTLREMTGKRSRDEQPTPQEALQEEQAKQKEAAEKEALKQAALRRVGLENEELAAKVAKTMADAQKIQAEAQSMGVDGEVRRQFDEKMAQVRDDTKKLIDALTDKLREAQNKLNDKTYEIDKRYLSDLGTAKIKADSDAEVARIKAAAENEREIVRQEVVLESEAIQADAQKVVDRVTGQLDELRKMVAEAQAAASDAERAAEKAAKEADRRVKEVEKVNRESDRADKQAAAPVSPVVVVIPPSEGGDGEGGREIDIAFQTDAEGRITGAKGSSKRKASGAKKKPAKPAEKKD